jgi:hypothetical protein
VPANPHIYRRAEIFPAATGINKGCAFRALVMGDFQLRVPSFPLAAAVPDASLPVDIVFEGLLKLLAVREISQRPRVRAPRRTVARMLAGTRRARPVRGRLVEPPVALLQDDARAVQVHAP